MNTSCPYPLINTTHEPFISSCGIICGKDQWPPIYYTDAEVYLMSIINFCLTLLSIVISMMYFYIVLKELGVMKSNFFKLPFPRQAPSLIALGYLSNAIVLFSPFVFGLDSFICNHDDHSFVLESEDNVFCYFIAFAYIFTIHVVYFYSCMLSIWLFLGLQYPHKKWNTGLFHLIVLTLCFVDIFALYNDLNDTNLFPDWYLRICIPYCVSQKYVQYFIVPLILAITLTLLNLLSAKKLWIWRRDAKRIATTQEDLLVKASRMKPAMKSLQNRLLWYTLFQTASLLVCMGKTFYIWTNIEKFREIMMTVVNCEVKKTKEGKTDYEACVTDTIVASRPKMVIIFSWSFMTFLGLVGVFIFQWLREAEVRNNDIQGDSAEPLLIEKSVVSKSIEYSQLIDDCSSLITANTCTSGQSARTRRDHYLLQDTPDKKNGKEARSCDQKLILSQNV